jgi:hypothetical protein
VSEESYQTDETNASLIIKQQAFATLQCGGAVDFKFRTIVEMTFLVEVVVH